MGFIRWSGLFSPLWLDGSPPRQPLSLPAGPDSVLRTRPRTPPPSPIYIELVGSSSRIIPAPVAASTSISSVNVSFGPGSTTRPADSFTVSSGDVLVTVSPPPLALRSVRFLFPDSSTPHDVDSFSVASRDVVVHVPRPPVPRPSSPTLADFVRFLDGNFLNLSDADDPVVRAFMESLTSEENATPPSQELIDQLRSATRQYFSHADFSSASACSACCGHSPVTPAHRSALSALTVMNEWGGDYAQLVQLVLAYGTPSSPRRRWPNTRHAGYYYAGPDGFAKYENSSWSYWSSLYFGDARNLYVDS
jgi:hypothetical protein